MKLVMLLPPSEGKAPGGRAPWDPASGAFAALAPARATIAGHLAAAMADEPGAARLLGVKDKALTAARTANGRLGHGGAKVLPAWKRYTGVVWEHLGVATLDTAAKRRALRSVMVPSALLGVVALGDPVPDYKLKMGASLPGVGVLSSYWRPSVTEALAGVCSKALVVDLLPGEHRRAVDTGRLGAKRVVDVEFRAADGRASGHGAKAAKGSLARHLLTEPDALAALETFDWQGWRSAGVSTTAGRTVAVITAP